MNTLPGSLDRFGLALEVAIERELRTPRRTPVLLRRLVAVGAVAAAVVLAFAAYGAVSGNGPSLVDRAAAALAIGEGSILHVHVLGSQTNPDGSVASWDDETWQESSAPFARRSLELGPDGAHAEAETSGTMRGLYDPATNTIYQTTVQPPAAGTTRPVAPPTTPTTPDASALERRQDVQSHVHERVGYAPATKAAAGAQPKQAGVPAESGIAAVDPFRPEVLHLLHSGDAKEDGHVTIDGRDAIRIVSGDGSRTYIVDAKTYDPIEWRTTGAGGGSTLRFTAYQQLPATAANQALLGLAEQHPTARLDTNPADYDAAEARLYPHG